MRFAGTKKKPSPITYKNKRGFYLCSNTKCKGYWWSDTPGYCSSECREKPIIEASIDEEKIRKILRRKSRENRKNARTKRKKYTPEFRSIVAKRSGGICEQTVDGVRCENDAEPIHHLVSIRECVEKGIDQWDLKILIHLCVPCHRNAHPDLPEGLFKRVTYIPDAVV